MIYILDIYPIFSNIGYFRYFQ